MIFEIVILGQFSWFWYHSKALNETNTILVTTVKLKIFKQIYNLIILIDNSEKWLTVIFEPSLCQQSASEVFDLLEKTSRPKWNSTARVQNSLQTTLLSTQWSRNIMDFEANFIISSNIMVKEWIKNKIKY